MQPPSLPIREFVYFDREKVEDFVSALEGGLPKERKETRAEKSPQYDVGIDIRLKAERKGRVKESSWEEIRRATLASLFERLYSLLGQRNMIKVVNVSDAQQWDTLKAGEFVEFEGRIELSTLEMVFDLIKNFAPLIETLSPEQTQDKAYKNGLQIALMSQQDSHNVRIIPKGEGKGQFIFVASLQKDKARTNKEELRDEYTVFGRVKRKLAVNETFELFSPLPGGVKLPTNDIRNLLTNLKDNLKDVESLIGTELKMEDLRVSYPAIILTPIAIYR